MFEFVAQIVLEVIAYGVGRIFVWIFLPWYRVEPVDRHDDADDRRWKWRGVSYIDGGKRVMRAETAQLIGVVILIAVAVTIYGITR